MMPLRDVVIFNDMLLPLFVGREKSVKAVEEAVSKDRFLLVVTQKESGIENPKPEEIFEVGTVSRILRMLKLPDGRLKALVQGVSKARIIKYVRKKTSYRVKIELIDDPSIPEMTIKTEALMRNVRENSEKILALAR
jgi:ATP-dependent Lon protease